MADLDDLSETEDDDIVEIGSTGAELNGGDGGKREHGGEYHDTTNDSTDDQSTNVEGASASRKIGWSGSEDDRRPQLFKHRKKRRKKQTAPRRDGLRDGETGVGHKTLSAAERRRRSQRHNDAANRAAEDVLEDDQLMEYTLPDYLQERRAKFDLRTERFREAGLKLPPSYDDVYFSDDERLAELAEKPDFPTGRPMAPYSDKQLPQSLGLIPAPIMQWLRDYQVKGAEFLHRLFVYQTGGILGDDMGLGKTVQVIAFLTAAYGKTGDERDTKRMRKMRRADTAWYPRTLVICPGSLIENWKTEFNRWGWWHIDVFHGPDKEIALEAAAQGMLEIMITTYTTYRINKGAINMVDWDCVIADECHQIKGRASEITQALNEVNALCRIGLTGTAIQNSYDELWTLLNWTNPGKFGPISTWKQTISIPLKTGQSHEATMYQLAKARKTAKALVENLLPQFFLRRMKTLIADQLPKKRDRVVFCPLTATQADAYVNILNTDVARYVAESGDPCTCGSKKKKGWCCQAIVPDTGERWQRYVFPLMMNLQKLSNHLAILIPHSSDTGDKQSKDLETLQAAVPDQWRELYRTRDSIINYANPEFCGKWKVLRKLLAFWHSAGDKVLVFSHSVRLLKMLQLLFQHTTYNVSYLDGGMKYDERAKAVDDFNADPHQFVFLISTKAGGTGLNIASANKVVVVDPNWNPAYDLQAQDRAYRLGQVRDVEVFRLVSAGTIEEIVYARQIYKQQQANIGYTASAERRYFTGVQEDRDQKGELFGLKNMFTFIQSDSSAGQENLLLRDIVNKTNVAESKAGVAILESHIPLSTTNYDGEATSSTEQGGGEGEEEAISQLAHALTRDNPLPSNQTSTPSKDIAPDPVKAILASAGVTYTHDNAQVVGSSHVESSLSRRATASTTISNGHGQGSKIFVNGSQENKRYRPPQHVRVRQLYNMARLLHHYPSAKLGIAEEEQDVEVDVVGFAMAVEARSQAERRDMLARYYALRSEMLDTRDEAR